VKWLRVFRNLKAQISLYIGSTFAEANRVFEHPLRPQCICNPFGIVLVLSIVGYGRSKTVSFSVKHRSKHLLQFKLIMGKIETIFSFY